MQPRESRSNVTNTFDRLKTALADRYSIEEEVGAGGMATVYRAEDLKHHRKVAVKVLRPELAAVLGAERFLKEIEVTANLQHPHILPLFDSGEADGFLYYVMPFVEGESLADKLYREGQLSLEESIAMAEQVAAALDYAHAHGVVHRDIKPDNIMLSSGEAIVSDFGIARAVNAAGGEQLTGTGMALGTPAYMSPEQCAGDSDIDGRTDIYALGSLLYELLAGEPPYTGPTAQAIIAKRMSEPVPQVSTLRETVPQTVEAAINKALAKTPADRFATAGEFADALNPSVVTPATGSAPRRVGFATAAVLAVIAIVAVAIIRTGGSADADGTALVAPLAQRSIAVLPFDDMSADQDQEYMSDGIAEELLNLLARIPELRVISRTSAFSFKGQDIDIPTIAARLNVAHVLEGSVRKAGNTIRITAQLVDAQSDTHVWSQTYDRALDDIFAIQDEISAAIVEALSGTLGLETAPRVGEMGLHLALESQVVSAEAYDLYLRGLQAFGGGTTAAYRSAQSYFEQAIALEPTYAVAHARLSRALFALFEDGVREVPNDLVREAANEAIRLDSTLGLPYTVLSMVEEREGRGLSDLTLELRTKGYALAPNDPFVTMHYGRAFEWRGRMSESVPLMRKAVELDPLDVEQRAVFGIFLTLRGRPTEGLRESERAIEIDPGSRFGWHYKGWASSEVGDLESSIEAYRMAHELDPEYSTGAAQIAFSYLFLGDLEAARTWRDVAMRRGLPQSIVFEARYLLLDDQGGEALALALRELDTQGSPYTNATVMQIVIGDMIARGALGEAERFLLRYDDRLADFVAGPVQSFADAGLPDANIGYAIALQDVYKRAGRTAEADALADRLDFDSMKGRWSAIQLGWTSSNYLTEARWHMRGGRPSEALSALERAVELGYRFDWQFRIRDYFVFEDLRETARFRALIETIEGDMARRREILAERTAAWVEELTAGGSGAGPRN